MKRSKHRRRMITELHRMRAEATAMRRSVERGTGDEFTNRRLTWLQAEIREYERRLGEGTA